jgi:hypothetical protein
VQVLRLSGVLAPLLASGVLRGPARLTGRHDALRLSGRQAAITFPARVIAPLRLTGTLK